MESVFANSNKVLVDSKSNNNLMYLPLDKIISNSDRSKKGPDVSRSETVPVGGESQSAPDKTYGKSDQYSTRSRTSTRERR